MRHLCQTLAMTALLGLPVPMAFAADNVVDANIKLLEAGDTVAVSKIPDGVYLRSTNDPDDIIWDRLPEYRVHVGPAPAVHQSVELRVDYDDEGQFVYLTLGRTSERLYVRMRWYDATLDTKTQSNRFRDGAAVQFSLADDETSYIMGDGPDAPVNIWYWRSDKATVQNLAAGGPGSTTILDEQPVTGSAEYIKKENEDANEWVVVMSREIASEGEYNAKFDRDQIPMAFALWQGSNNQRDGFKYVTDGWILADLKGESK